MNKKFFDFRLYIEGIRQTRIVGIILSVAIIGLSALIPLTSFIEYWQYDEAAKAAVIPSPIEIMNLAPVLILFMFVAPFILCMMQFGFLNKRKASDFYHSIPNTRTSIFFSFSAVVFTWLAFVIVASTLVSALIYTLCPMTTINLTFIPYTIFTYLAGALLIFAATILAMSITGTGITNFVVTGLILFFPRLISIVFSQIVNSILLITTSADFGILTDAKYNIPVGFIKTILMSSGSSSDLLQSVSAIVYSLVLAAVYILVAWLLFTRRKSETAEKSAPNKMMQHIYRCLITIPLSLVIPSVLVTEGFNSASSKIVIIIIAFISLIIYYSYELITTKRVVNLLKATPVLIFVIAFNVIFAFGILLTKQMVLGIKPSSSEIKSVYLSTDENQQYDRSYSYNERLLQNVTFTDETLKQLVSDSLKETIDLVEEGKQRYSFSYANNMVNKSVTIDTKNNGKITRNILFSNEEIAKIKEIQLASKEYVAAVSELPEVNSKTNISFSNMDKAEVLKLWETFKNEWETLSVEDKAIVNGTSEIGTESTSATYLNSQIVITGYYGFDEYTSNFGLSSLMPKTFNLAIPAVNKANSDTTKEILSEIFDKDAVDANLSLTRLSGNSSGSDFTTIYFYLNNGETSDTDFSLEQAKTIEKTVSEALNNEIDLNNIYVLNLSNTKYYDNNSYRGKDSNYYLTLTKEQEAVLNELSVKYKLQMEKIQ